jgi:hypothetical protein
MKERLRLTPQVKEILQETANQLKGSDRRMFMAKTVNALGKGGQRKAESKLGWDRKTIRKGQSELISGPIKDNFCARGCKKAEERLPNLLKDIQAIVEPESQADPTFRTTRLYTPLSAGEVRNRLLEEKKYTKTEIPAERTIRDKLNDLGYYPRKVAKTKPQKK